MADLLPNPESTQSTYFKLEWEYDLVLGHGRISLIVNEDQPDLFLAFAHSASFQTKGFELTNIDATRPITTPDPFGEVSVTMDGLDTYRYEVPQAALSHQLNRIDVTFDFPTDNIGLWESDFSTVLTLSAANPFVTGFVSQDTPFISVQQIPEPTSLGLLGFVASLFGLRRSRPADHQA